MQIKNSLLFIMSFFSSLSYADNYYSNYFSRATKLIIPMANAQEVPTEELPKPKAENTYIVPALKTDDVHKAKNSQVINRAKKPKTAYKAIYLNAKTKRGLNLAEQAIDADDYARPSKDGVVRFQYGTGQPTIVCAPLKVCSIMLEKNELVASHNIGDPTSWEFNTPDNGNDAITVKPKTPNISTNALIFTIKNGVKRNYNIQLIAHPSKYMPFIAFNHADDADSKNARYYADVKAKIAKEEKETVVNAKYALRVNEADSKYDVSGNANFKIDQIITDNVKTYIYLKDFNQGDELPFFLGLTSDKKELMVNQYFDNSNSRIIVDYKVINGYLLAGNEKLKIAYKGQK